MFFAQPRACFKWKFIRQGFWSIKLKEILWSSDAFVQVNKNESSLMFKLWTLKEFSIQFQVFKDKTLLHNRIKCGIKWKLMVMASKYRIDTFGLMDQSCFIVRTVLIKFRPHYHDNAVLFFFFNRDVHDMRSATL